MAVHGGSTIQMCFNWKCTYEMHLIEYVDGPIRAVSKPTSEGRLRIQTDNTPKHISTYAITPTWPRNRVCMHSPGPSASSVLRDTAVYEWVEIFHFHYSMQKRKKRIRRKYYFTAENYFSTIEICEDHEDFPGPKNDKFRPEKPNSTDDSNTFRYLESENGM